MLPNGPLDVVRQVALFAAAYWAYRIVRGQIDGPPGLDGVRRTAAT